MSWHRLGCRSWNGSEGMRNPSSSTVVFLLSFSEIVALGIRTAMAATRPQLFLPPTFPVLGLTSINLGVSHRQTLSTRLRSVVNPPSSTIISSSQDHEDDRDSNLLLVPAENAESAMDGDLVDYNWTEEWYPLYLSQQVPDDAPLGLTVFDRQLVLYKDEESLFRCFEDRCPHRLAKLSEGQVIDGKLECLYHGWQFEGAGNCVKIPQLPEGAKIPRSACARTYVVKESQGVVWAWMSQKTPPDEAKLPWFENFSRPGFHDISSVHELPYDHSILLENLMDPAHVPISHDRTDFKAKRELASPLTFEVTERTDRGFAGRWSDAGHRVPNFVRFEAPCVLSSNNESVDKNGEKHYSTGLFLCRPAGQGKSMVIVRFGFTKRSLLVKMLPNWFIHLNSCKVFEQDMGFLSSQNQVLMREKVPTKNLYINLKSSDVWVSEYRKWLDKVGHGMPYYIGNNSISLPSVTALEEQAPAGLVAAGCSSLPAKGGIGSMFAPNLTNRYLRHVVHCKECRRVVTGVERWKMVLTAGALMFTALAILASSRQWKGILLVSACLSFAGVQACSYMITLFTTNFVRRHRIA